MIEDKALKAYHKMSRVSEPHGVIPADNETHYLGDGNSEKREGYIKGYIEAIQDTKEWLKQNAGRNIYVCCDECGFRFYRSESLAEDLENDLEQK